MTSVWLKVTLFMQELQQLGSISGSWSVRYCLTFTAVIVICQVSVGVLEMLFMSWQTSSDCSVLAKHWVSFLFSITHRTGGFKLFYGNADKEPQ